MNPRGISWFRAASRRSILAHVIPPWLPSGFLPPTLHATTRARSPYRASPLELVDRFSLSEERADLLRGLLDFRAALREVASFEAGFQWIDGSFLEHVEVLEERAPRDIDVVTFVPFGGRQQHLLGAAPHLFRSSEIRSRFQLDHYFVDLDRRSREELIQDASYWYSMWSHRRDGGWKGFIELGLLTDDSQARLALDARQAEEGD